MCKEKKVCRSKQIGFGAIALASLALAIPSICHANPEDALNFVVGTTATYDNNLFRLSSGEQISDTEKSSRSDMIYTAFAGVSIDKTYSLQRFQADLTATRYEYRTHDFLNFTAIDYRAAWLWSLSPRLTGVLSADRDEKPTSYADFENQRRKNIQTRETRRLMADWQMLGAWHLTGGVYQTRLDNTANFTAVGDYVQDTAEAGVKYVSAANNSVAAVHRQSRGEYSGRTLNNDDQLDTHYKQGETELRTIWRFTGHSLIDGRIAYLDRTHRHYEDRDYSGAVGRVSYQWTPTGKLQFTLAAGRDLQSYQDNASSYYTYDYISFIPAWLITDKTSIRLKLDFGKRDYDGEIIGSTNREDSMRTAQLAVTWQPTQTINLNSYLTREQRSSNIADHSYHDTIAGISAVLKF